MNENIDRSYILRISETEVSLATYNVSINGNGLFNISLTVLNSEGLVLDFINYMINGTGDLTNQITVDNTLDRIIVAIENRGWNNVKGNISLTYTRSPFVLLFISIATTVIGICGTSITVLGFLQYIISRKKQEEDG